MQAIFLVGRHFSASNNCLKCTYEVVVGEGHLMLERTSYFVLNVLPYVIIAAGGTVIVPALFH